MLAHDNDNIIQHDNKTTNGLEYNWPLCYEAEYFISHQLEKYLARNTFASTLAKRMLNETGSEFIDWVDYCILSNTAESNLREVGYIDDPIVHNQTIEQKYLWHPLAKVPRVILDRDITSTDYPGTVAIRVDDITEFILRHNITAEMKGEEFSRLRSVTASYENNTQFEVVQRCGYRGYVLEKLVSNNKEHIRHAHEQWRQRKRVFTDDEDGFRHTNTLLDQLITSVGRDVACDVVFAEERAYWESRNHVAQFQKRRQDHLGLGWANHDHHTFRSSRKHFIELLQMFEKLGFKIRERYYAGAEAGWGAQVLEHPINEIVVFCDVDLSQEETDMDFSRQQLPSSKKLGTVGLWVELHGESILEAGMHHLECRFNFQALQDQLEEGGIHTMKAFSDFPFLKQAFTEGEWWQVKRERLERLLHEELIDKAQFEKFLHQGAIGSHLENLQRKGGFKGFNQKSVSTIIVETDPRTQVHTA